MSVENILERISVELVSANKIGDPDLASVLRDAANALADRDAEIGRLRGEVEALLEDPDEAELAYRCGDPDSDAIVPAEAKDPAPAMPNGAEAARVLADFAETAPGRLPGRVQEAIATIRAADNRDAAGVVPVCPATGCGAQVLYECPACSHHNYPPRDTPAAVPAGEAVAVCGTCNGVGMIGGHRGQTPDSFEQWAEDCPDCTPQPADGGAVAEWQVWHEQDGWGATHPDNVAEYRARGVPVRPLYAHPPAPVQAAPQEGEWNAAIEAAASEAEHWQALSGSTHKCGDYIAGAIRTMKRAALQHRGDSRGGES